MEIKYCGKVFKVELNSLSEQTIKGLREKVKEIIPNVASLPDKNVVIYYKMARLTSDPEVTLESVNITNESTVCVLAVPKSNSTENTQKNESQTTNNHNGVKPHPDAAAFQQQMASPAPGMNFPGIDPTVAIDMLSKNPGMLETIMNQFFGNTNPQAKEAMQKHFEMMMQNPELLKSIMSMQGNGGFGPMSPPPGGMFPQVPYSPTNNQSTAQIPYWQQPPYSPPQQQSPLGNMMHPGYAGNYSNMVHSPNLASYQQEPPANGPCSHGFYPPQVVDGKPVPQDAEKVYVEQLKAMEEMGFCDKEENVKALNKSKGDISAAVDHIMDYRNKK